MRQYLILVLGILATLACRGSAALESEAQHVIAFIDVNIVPMDSERVLQHQSVIVSDDRIVHIGPVSDVDVPTGALKIAGHGGYLMPGLADMHVHAWKENLLTYVANGVTSVRFMHGHPNILAWRDQIAEGQLLGPTIYTAGPTVDGPPQEGANVVETSEEAVRIVAEQSAAGYDFVKVYNDVPRQAYEGLVAAAKQHDLPVVGHVPFEVGLEGAFSAGQKSVEHLRGYIFELVTADAPVQPGATMRSRALAWNYADRSKFSHLARMTRDAGVWNCPTLVDMQHWTLPSEEYENLFLRPNIRFLSNRSQQRDRSEGWLGEFSEADFESARKALEIKKEFVGALHVAGAGILLGTDDWMSGFSVHEELQNLVDAGLTPFEAISAGTRDAAEFLGASGEFGTITPGKRADLILLKANPLESVGNVARRRGVMVRGRWIPEARLRQMLEALALLIENDVVG
jgi:imidazolonepropionase-like amidohydrolase